MTTRLAKCLIAALGLMLAVAAVQSLRWRFFLDSPIMLYTGMLVGRFGLVPYRDFFDMNMPGTILFSAAAGRLFGVGDLGLRCADLLWLGLLGALTIAWMRRLDRLAGWFGALTFALVYLDYGPATTLEREVIALVPIAAALAAALASRPGPRTRAFLCGLGWGAAATIKPHLALGFPATLLYLIIENPAQASEVGPTSIIRNPREKAQWAFGTAIRNLLLPALLGLALPLALMLGWLASAGALGEFLDIVRHYWPLYAALGGEHASIHGAERLAQAARGLLELGGLWRWTVAAALGSALLILHPASPPARRRAAALLAALIVTYAIYPALSGQFWAYHWLPLLYFLIQGGALCLGRVPQPLGPAARRAIPLLFILTLAPFFAGWARHQWASARGPQLKPAAVAQADSVAGFLKTHLRPGEAVQVLDWNGGAQHGALIAGAPPATRFLYDFHFYHDVSTPTIQGLRVRFIKELRQAHPRFIIQALAHRPLPSGPDSSTEFPALDALLRDETHVAAQDWGCVIYEWPQP